MKTQTINNKHYQKCDVVMLPTDKESKLCFVINTENSTLTLFEDPMEKGKRFFPQHLYILSNEEIKKDDWFIDLHNLDKPKFCDNQQLANKLNLKKGQAKKIISTNDKSLKSDTPKLGGGSDSDFAHYPSIPQISQQFIEYFINEYNKGNVVSKVLVEIEGIEWLDKPLEYFIKLSRNNEISILTEQKTVENLAEEIFPTAGKIEDYRELEVNIPKQEGFIVGYNKAKSEQSYSREEVDKLLFDRTQLMLRTAVFFGVSYHSLNDWINQNLK
jgi:hypothetical protein